MLMPNAGSALIANKFSLHGPNATYCVACASGAVAVGNAAPEVKRAADYRTKAPGGKGAARELVESGEMTRILRGVA